MTRHDEDGDLAGFTPADTLGPDAALIAELLASQKRLVEKVNDWVMRARTAEARLARAEECIVDFRVGINWAPYSEGWHLMNKALAAYDAAKEASDG